MGGPGQACAQSEIDRIKALHVYNFLLFVDWPEEADQKRDHLEVGIMGDPNLWRLLGAMDRKKIKGKELIIMQVNGDGSLLGSLHVLFIGASLRHEAPRILEELKGQPVLTMSDMAGFTEMGGMVRFTYLNRQPDKKAALKRFKVNLKAVESAGLSIRSQLLRLSHIVTNTTQ